MLFDLYVFGSIFVAGLLAPTLWDLIRGEDSILSTIVYCLFVAFYPVMIPFSVYLVRQSRKKGQTNVGN